LRFAGALPVTRVPADLDAVVREALDELRMAWPGREIALQSIGDLRGAWDPARIAQVISNLVGNALAHGDQQQPVRVTARATGEGVRLEVWNGGPPIPEALRPVLFEPFHRGRTHSRGLGLGLYIVQQIVQAHGGHIEMSSTAEAGTRFAVHLPRQPRDEVAANV
jgi:signal transduction histidine kinase